MKEVAKAASFSLSAAWDSQKKKLDKRGNFVLILTIVEDCARTRFFHRQNALKSLILSASFVHFDIQCFSVINTSAFGSVCFSYIAAAKLLPRSSILYLFGKEENYANL